MKSRKIWTIIAAVGFAASHRWCDRGGRQRPDPPRNDHGNEHGHAGSSPSDDPTESPSPSLSDAFSPSDSPSGSVREPLR